ncbi:MAG: SusD/RagB family nutrient-binding outer membrane lipoprotein [Salinibacter sp.]|uniref:SusD/RagB family nutrient-binding outer membrane lipoprotein n=1 Tax=Salinibacter sp. TaxID=2065818 RepID=UPI0035D4E298
MRYIYHYRVLTSLLLVAVLSVGVLGCDSFTSGYDKDPNSATETTANLALNSAQVAAILYQDGNQARMASIFNSQLTGADRQYAGFNSYNVNSSDFDNMWVTGYADVIGDLSVVKEKTRGSNALVLGIAQVIEAYTFGTKAALHGSVPMKEAAKGDANLNPKFTPQMDVYSAVVGSLDVAISNLQAGGISPGDKDIFFGGEAQKWIETAYTLKARFLLHMNRPGDALAAAQNGISDPSNNLMASHGATRGVDSNPFWLFHDIERTGYLQAADSYAAKILDDSTSAYRGNAKTDESARFNDYFIGDPGGWDLNTASGAYFGQTSDYPLVTYRENELIKAEAYVLRDNSGDMASALTALNNAREAADAQYSGDDYYQNYEMEDFQSDSLANPQGESQRRALLRETLEEKYVSLMAHIEVFNDVRRTDNFLNIPPKRGGQLPQRFLIAQTEINANNNAPQNPPGIFEVTPANQFDYPGF